jgi:hypothetical protein
MTNINVASTQWANRPDDQRFLSIADLKASVDQRKSESWTLSTQVKDLRAKVSEKGLVLDAFDRTRGERTDLEPSHWAFGQLASYAGAPAPYLRKLPFELAAINLQWGLEHAPIRDDALVLGQSNGHQAVRAMTSTSYGRIWDSEVVEAVERVNPDGRWQVPAASYASSNPKRATTLYASDRDVFMFLVDPEHPIAVPGEKSPLFRGFYVWNSEVGAATFGLTTFLYRYVCDNRIIWGATDVQELRIRHTGGAPQRFAYEGAKYLERYANESTASLVEPIVKAQAFEVPQAEKPGSGWESWLRDRGFSAAESKSAVQSAIAEEGEARSLWDIVNGITASARQLTHTDARVELETRAGKLLSYVR